MNASSPSRKMKYSPVEMLMPGSFATKPAYTRSFSAFVSLPLGVLPIFGLPRNSQCGQLN